MTLYDEPEVGYQSYPFLADLLYVNAVAVFTARILFTYQHTREWADRCLALRRATRDNF